MSVLSGYGKYSQWLIRPLLQRSLDTEGGFYQPILWQNKRSRLPVCPCFRKEQNREHKMQISCNKQTHRERQRWEKNEMAFLNTSRKLQFKLPLQNNGYHSFEATECCPIYATAWVVILKQGSKKLSFDNVANLKWSKKVCRRHIAQVTSFPTITVM